MARNEKNQAAIRAAFIKRAQKVVAEHKRSARTTGETTKLSPDVVGQTFRSRDHRFPGVVKVIALDKDRVTISNINTGRSGSIGVHRFEDAYKPFDPKKQAAEKPAQTPEIIEAKVVLAEQIAKLHPEVKDDVNMYVELLERAIAERNPSMKPPDRMEAVVIQTTDAAGHIKGRQVLRVNHEERVGIHVIPAEMANAEIMKAAVNGNGTEEV